MNFRYPVVMPELLSQLNSLDVKSDKLSEKSGRIVGEVSLAHAGLLLLRENQVQHNGGDTASSDAGREQGFQPVRGELQDQRLL